MKVTTDSKRVLLVSPVNLVETEILVKEVYQAFKGSLEKMEGHVVYVHLDQRAKPVRMVKMVLLVNPDAPVSVEDPVKEASLVHKEKTVSPDSLVWRVHQVAPDRVETKVKRVKLS